MRLRFEVLYDDILESGVASIFLHHFGEVAFYTYEIKYCKSEAMAVVNIHQHHNQTSSEQNTWATMILKGNGTSR